MLMYTIELLDVNFPNKNNKILIKRIIFTIHFEFSIFKIYNFLKLFHFENKVLYILLVVVFIIIIFSSLM